MDSAPAHPTADQFYQTYQRLFPPIEQANTAPDSAQFFTNNPNNNSYPFAQLPPDNLLQLPYPKGEYWRIGGSHTNTGSGSYPQSSLDLNNGGSWGSDTSNKWVTASAGGKVKKHSSCFVEVVHEGGWSTTYYHLGNVVVNSGQTVERNQRLAN
ncbi:M23 family metallopeptidase [Zooshikella ganghwensis]|nr:M23 family metallopeptidase [Zooshikella ganghwensis]